MPTTASGPSRRATGAVSAVIVDFSRLIVYGTGLLAEHFGRLRELMPAVAVAVLCAFAGAVIGKRLLQKVTLRAVQRVVVGMMLPVGGGLVTGLI